MRDLALAADAGGDEGLPPLLLAPRARAAEAATAPIASARFFFLATRAAEDAFSAASSLGATMRTTGAAVAALAVAVVGEEEGDEGLEAAPAAPAAASAAGEKALMPLSASPLGPAASAAAKLFLIVGTEEEEEGAWSCGCCCWR